MFRNLIKSCKQVADGLVSGVPLGPKPIVLFSFQSQRVVDQWHVFSDAFFGGKSQAKLTYNEQEQAAEFSGYVTLEQQADADIKRAGYCMASSKVQRIGDYWDLSGISSLVYTVWGDGRAYIANVRTDSLAGTGGDLWQAPFRTRAGEWARVVIPIDDLSLTYQGQLVERKLEFQADKVISVGVAVSAALSEPSSSSDRSSSSSSRSEDRMSDDSSRRDSPATAQDAGSLQASDDALSDVASSTEDDRQAGTSAHEQFRILIREISAEGEM